MLRSIYLSKIWFFSFAVPIFVLTLSLINIGNTYALSCEMADYDECPGDCTCVENPCWILGTCTYPNDTRYQCMANGSYSCSEVEETGTCNNTCGSGDPTTSCMRGPCAAQGGGYCVRNTGEAGRCLSCIPNNRWGCTSASDCCGGAGESRCTDGNWCENLACSTGGEACSNDSDCCSDQCDLTTGACVSREDVESQGLTFAYEGPQLTIEQLISLIYRILLPVSIAFGVYNIIRAGYLIKTSEGNPTKKQQGVDDLTSAIVGTIFVGLSLTLLNIIIRSVIGG